MRVGLVKSAVLAFAFAIAAPAYASVIAVFGDRNGSAAVTSFLAANNLKATNLGEAPPQKLDELAGYDVLIALRSKGSDAIKEFVLGGGLLITEFDAAVWALDPLGLHLLNADAGSTLFLGKGTTISFTPEGLKLGLGDGLGKSYADGDRTNAQTTLSNLGAGVSLLATGPEPMVPLVKAAGLRLLDSLADDLPVMIGGNSGEGYTLINSLAWSEGLPTTDSPTGTWLLNALNVQQTQPIPEPGGLALLGLALACLTFTRRQQRA